ncbi:TAT-variant-translocated molybdopterin oxidoreductase [Phaeodactylibacter luteus]|uniref:4Fe-4S dicluster domain-containing protein n=1 Tax=Phaeodactylibacter luteus TaxID=1564516 RepID=A0A5C6RM22_9BACT|nr:TAT-variant-translocated molybdopterin oxidoreductase [Phaeodactylibacter luteus]TXB62959.1 4Fe-4S dicluster domain-containing protein [Phaeodactylibacter luteus]
MKNNNNGVWIGVEQLQNDPSYQEANKNEFAELPVVDSLSNENTLGAEASRRDFLKYLGFGLGAATLAASCEIPVKRAIPYVVKPDEIVPGVATYYASSFVQGGDYCSILVKTREGRPIKIEGNTLSGITKGGTSARAQALVLGLYDTNRLDGPYRIADGKIQRSANRNDRGPSWAEIDKEVMGKLSASSSIRILGNTIMSPTTKKALADFKAAYPNAEVVMYDPVSSSALLEANEASFGQAVVPDYHFDKANVIVSFDADFLGTWVSPVEFAAQYVKNRKAKKGAKMSRHIQVESHMSLTGSNADNRILVRPSEQGAAIVALYNAVAAKTGNAAVNGPKLSGDQAKKLQKVADELYSNRGASLIVSGSNNKGEQILINGINNMLGNYGKTLDFAHASMQRQGRDKAVQDLISDMNNGRVDALFVMDGANPAFDLPNKEQFAAAASKVKLKVSFSTVPNETVALCDYIAPTHHLLESWGDVEAKRGQFSLVQPAIAPIFNTIGRAGTRQAEESLLRWANYDMMAGMPADSTAVDAPNGYYDKLHADAGAFYFEYLKQHWQEAIFPMQRNFATFQAFWDSALHDGVFEVAQEAPVMAFAADVSQAAGMVRKPSNAELEISFFETVNMGGGVYGNNPWLLEMPDPVNRCSWGNYLAIPVGWDGGNEFTSFMGLNPDEVKGKADIVEVTVAGKAQRCTVVRQFGQMPGTVSIALGYGRTETGMLGNAVGNNVGVDTYPWMSLDQYGNVQYYATVDSVSERVGVEDEFACVQYHHSMGLKGIDPESGEEINVDEKTVMTLGSGFQGGLTNRSIIYQGNIAELDELEHHIEEKRSEAQKLNSHTLYPYDEYKENVYGQGHHWAMHIDLSACIGCGACQVACIAENNVPVVGKKEVARHHEMTWLRIDRYFYGDYENPNVVYQPMMCQHCDNAPCENVCPVAATNHSSEGLNQMTYNRCIGTRYCANNCPYKVRRFNWLDYTTADLFGANEYELNGEEALPFGADNLTRMVLNPDVTVRSRGVIEKCSFCVQRIQEGKLTAKREQRQLRDQDVKTACQTACPTGAIVFGDSNNKEGLIAERMESPLNYLVLEEINTQSAVRYQARVNNKNEELDA